VTRFPASLDPARYPVRRFRDPAADAAADTLPDWWPGDRRALVYVTFGSVAAQYPPAAVVYGHAFEAAAGVDARVLLTVVVGAEVDAGEAPPNVRVERWVPQRSVLREATLVVGHGGAGTTLGRSRRGCRSSPYPLFVDQPQNAMAAAAAGAAVVAPLDGIRAAVERVLGNGSYRTAARRIADEMRALPPVDEFVAAP
jgi:UDP:flavonoid glycosyltransferase YjiC (YdhE family)